LLIRNREPRTTLTILPINLSCASQLPNRNAKKHTDNYVDHSTTYREKSISEAAYEDAIHYKEKRRNNGQERHNTPF
jgi:hypothetical protein